MQLFTDLPDMNHVATALNKVGGEWLKERLYRTPDGAWIMRDGTRPQEELNDSDVAAWLEAPHSILVSKVSVERPDAELRELIEAGYIKAA